MVAVVAEPEPERARDALDNLGEALVLAAAVAAIAIARPRFRYDCKDAQRPCPFAGCRSNMILDLTDAGEIILNSGQIDAERGEGANREIGPDMPDAEFHERVDAALEWWRASYARARRLGTKPPDSCLEDIIDRHLQKLKTLPDDEIVTEGMHLETIGHHMFITRERARQIEASVWTQLQAIAPRLKRILEEALLRRKLARKLHERRGATPWAE